MEKGKGKSGYLFWPRACLQKRRETEVGSTTQSWPYVCKQKPWWKRVVPLICWRMLKARVFALLCLWNPGRRCGWGAQQRHCVERNGLDQCLVSWVSWLMCCEQGIQKGLCVLVRQAKIQKGPVDWQDAGVRQRGKWSGGRSPHHDPQSKWDCDCQLLTVPGTRPGTELQRPIRVHWSHHLNPKPLFTSIIFPSTPLIWCHDSVLELSKWKKRKLLYN